MTPRAFPSALGLLAVVAAYFALTAGHLPLPQYIPLEHRWTTDVPPGAIGMDWYARAAGAFAVGLVGYGAGALATKRFSWARRASSTRLLFGLAFGLMGWSAMYIVFALASTPRARAPEPESAPAVAPR